MCTFQKNNYLNTAVKFYFFFKKTILNYKYMENYGYYSKEINEDCFVVYYFSRRARSVIYQTSSLSGALS